MPDFGSQSYWDERFDRDAEPFDWLLPPRMFVDFATRWVEAERLKKAEILHIGCGTSDCSVLAGLVDEPRQVHNVDFSQAGIDAAASRERELAQKKAVDLIEAENKHDSVHSPEIASTMRWSCLDLLSLPATMDLMEQQLEANGLFDLVLDKSTSDSIACAVPPAVSLPYPLSINGWTRGISQSGMQQRSSIHPLHLLAVNLAALTRPRTGKWIAISYSEDRFPFLPPYPQTMSHGLLLDDIVKAGFPHPSQLWRLEAKQRVVVEESLTNRRKRLSTGVTHRPEVAHWLYVMIRTDTLITY